MKTLFELGNWFIRYLVDPPLRLLTQPPSAEDHSQAQKDGQAGPGDAVQGRFGAAGTAEHRASAGSQAAHAITLGAMEQHQNDQ